MNILIVSFYYPPELGAAPARIANMVTGLKEHGHKVDVLTCLPNYPKGQIFEGYRRRFCMVEHIDESRLFRYWTYATVSRKPFPRALAMGAYAAMLWLFAFRRKTILRYDRIIVQSPPLPVASSAMALFNGLYRRKVLLNISDLWPKSAVELGAMREGGRIHRIFSALERYVYRKSAGILGQSESILKHVAQMQHPEGKLFLYRNLQRVTVADHPRQRGTKLRIVYAGLLGVAQDIAGIVREIDFEALGVEFHIYGGGHQTEEIEKLIAEGKGSVFYHGYVNKADMAGVLDCYDASIVPLAHAIEGAVPSKIFDLMPLGMPILFCGGGEGANIVEQRELGLTSPPGDINSLVACIKQLRDMKPKEFAKLSRNGLEAARTDFDFDGQMNRLNDFILHI